MPDSRKTADGEPLDIRNAIDRSTKRRALTELAAEGYDTVRVLDEKQVDELIRKAVDEVVHASTQEHRARIVAEARKQLDKLLKQAKAFKSSAELLQTDKNELVARVENLQKQLAVRQKIEEEAASLVKRLKDSDELVAKLETALDAEQKRAAEVEQGLRAYALLQERYQQGQSEAKKLHSETIKLEKAKSRTEKEVEKVQADLAAEKAASAELERAKARFEKEIEKLEAELAGAKAKSDREIEQAHHALAKEKQKSTELAHKSVEAFGHFEESQERLKKLEKDTEHAHLEAARLKKELAQEAEAHETELKKARASTISWKSDKQAIERLEALLIQERAREQDAVQELKKVADREATAREEAERLGKQLAHAHEELKQIDVLEKQAAHERDALKSARAELASRERDLKALEAESASLRQSVAKLRKTAKSNAAISAVREQLKVTEQRYEEKLAEARGTSRRLRADAGRAAELESRLAREQSKARKAQEQLALPRRIDGDLKHLQDKLKETRESGLATRKLAQQANEAVESVEKLIDRLTKRVPKRR